MKATWEAFAADEARKYGLDPGIVTRQIAAESSWNPAAFNRGSKATGLMQITPIAAKDMGYATPPADPLENIRAGVRFLAKQVKGFDGDVAKGLAAYNWGRGNVIKHGMEKMPAETRNYLTKILGEQYGMQAQGTGQAAPQVGAKMNAAEALLKKYTDSLGEDDIAREPASAPVGPAQDMAQDAAGVLGSGRLPTSNVELARMAAADTNPVSAFVGGAMRGITGAAGDVANWAERKLTGDASQNFLQRAAQPLPQPDYVPAPMQSVNEGAGDLGRAVGVGAAATNVAALPLRVLSTSSRIAPALRAASESLANAIGSGGTYTGVQGIAKNVLLRPLGGAISGVAADAAINPGGDTAPAAAAVGAAIPVAGALAGAAGRSVANIARPFMPGGPQKIAGGMITGALDGAAAQQQALARLRGGAGAALAAPSPYEVINNPRLNALVQALRSGSGDDTFAQQLLAKRTTQDAQRAAVLEGLGGTRAAVEAARKAREQAAGPLYAQARRQYGNQPVSLQGPNQVLKALSRSGEDLTSDTMRSGINSITRNLDAALAKPGAAPGNTLGSSAIRLNDALGARQNIGNVKRGIYENAPIIGGMPQQDAALVAWGSKISDSLGRAMERVTGLVKQADEAYAKGSVPVRANTAYTKIVDNIRTAAGATEQGSGEFVQKFSLPKLTNTLRDINPTTWKSLTDAQRKSLITLRAELQRATEALAPAGGLSAAIGNASGVSLTPAQRLMLAKVSGGVAGPMLNTAMESLGVPRKIGTAAADMLINDPTILRDYLERQLAAQTPTVLRQAGVGMLQGARQAAPTIPAYLLGNRQ